MASLDWILLDTETDGLTAPIHIVEIAAQRFNNITPVGNPFRVFLNHDVDIPEAATAIHGYDRTFLETNGINPINAYKRLREYASDLPICAHFLRYDWKQALVPELIRLRIDPIGKPGFCTWMLAKRSLPEMPTHRLDHLRDSYSLKCSRAHSAEGDVESVVDLLVRIIFPKLTSLGLDSINAIAEFSTTKPVRKCHYLIQGLDFEAEELKRKLALKEQIATRRAFVSFTKKQKALKEEKFLALFGLTKGKNEIEDILRPLPFEKQPLPVYQAALNSGLIEKNPRIEFKNKIFVFTATLAMGPRKIAIQEVERHGGIVPKNDIINEKVDYLILGEDAKAGWEEGGGGAKLYYALHDRIILDNSKVQLIRERDFVKCLNANQ